MEEHPDTKLVYCLAEFFDGKKSFWDLPKYDWQRLRYTNQIFVSCVFRRKDFDLTAGYNVNMSYGLEDWDFLLSFLHGDDKVYRIDEVLFYYRQKKTSRSTDVKPHEKQMIAQMILNHPELYKEHIDNIADYFYGIDYKNMYLQIRSSLAYRIGSLLLKPLKLLKEFIGGFAIIRRK